MIELQSLHLNSQRNCDELDVFNQKKILGGLKAGNSIQPNDNGSVSTFNYTHLESGDRGYVVNQVNAPPGSAVYVPFKDSGKVVNQVNNNAANSLAVLEGT
jgi:hypothetical protein